MRSKKKLKNQKKKLSVKEMLVGLRERGMSLDEIAVKIPCSRMTLVNWLNDEHEARGVNREAIERVYRETKGVATEVSPLEQLRCIASETLVDHEGLAELLGCTEQSVANWISGKTAPQGVFRQRIRNLYLRCLEEK